MLTYTEEELTKLEKYIAEYTSGVPDAIPEQDDRDLAISTLNFWIAKRRTATL